MNKIKFAGLFFSKVFLLIFAAFSSNFLCYAQDKVDLEINVQAASNTVYGGETLLYSVTVRNIGSARAKSVSLLQATHREIVSMIARLGNCEKVESITPIPYPYVCELGDLEQNQSVTLNFEIKIEDFGCENEAGNSGLNKEPLRKFADEIQRVAGNGEKIKNRGSFITEIYATSQGHEDNKENNKFELFANLLPSKNLPPYLEIISPNPYEELIVIRDPQKLTKIIFKIKAFDPDGKIQKVIVNAQQTDISYDPSDEKAIIDGKKYSMDELKNNDELIRKIEGSEAVKTAENTYTFILENPKLGSNWIFVKAYDNGNRVNTTSVMITVK